MDLTQLLHALRAEHADRITIFANGSAVLYAQDTTFHFHSLADLEKNFGQGSAPASGAPVDAPSTVPCTCHLEPHQP